MSDTLDNYKALASAKLLQELKNSISDFFAAAVLDLLAKEKKLETAIVLAGRVIDVPMIDTAQSLAAAAVESFDLDTLIDTMRTGLPYLQPRPQPEPLPATGVVSSEPIGLDGEDWEKKYAGQTEDNPE